MQIVTREGGFVHTSEIPPFMPPPEVVVWGSRVFVHHVAHRPDAALDREPFLYIEGLAWPLNPSESRLDA